MTTAADKLSVDRVRILAECTKYWGISALRPLQERAILAGYRRRDSLVVMPTGGGKSLCYQVPPLIAGRTDVVVSPLISLMKDQLDGLRECGYPASAIYSGLSPEAVREQERIIASGDCRLVFVAPERVLTVRFQNLIRPLKVCAFAIDEAHCISHWGHDFRAEYRALRNLRCDFPDASLHAFTATATQRVRDDIVAQLELRDADVMIGDFDRPNLVYRVVPRVDETGQTLEIIRRHAGQAVIVYCISRKDAEKVSAFLHSKGVKASHYHAGMTPEERRRTQDAFQEERIDVVVATVAFGMGIDRSDVRCVIHTAMPKSIEHYQQETGRAGRDGLEAECVLLYSMRDTIRWESLIAKGARDAERPAEVMAAAVELLRHMKHYASDLACRHKLLSEYFGQAYPAQSCGACDVCLGESDEGIDETVTAQKILSCVARVQERFGARHVADVLAGANTELIRSFGHANLSTYGLLKSYDRKQLTQLIYQLVDQRVLDREPGDRPILRLNAASWEVMRGQRKVKLRTPPRGEVKRSRQEVQSWEGVDRGLFEALRELRMRIAQERGVPAYIVFSDAVLRDMARDRPVLAAGLLRIKGIGIQKLDQYGEVFVTRIRAYCDEHNLSYDRTVTDDGIDDRPTPPVKQVSHRSAAFDMFARGSSLEVVAETTGRAISTVSHYLAEYILSERPRDPFAWVSVEVYRDVAPVVAEKGGARLKPIYDHFEGRFDYVQLRVVASHVDALGVISPD